MKTSISRRAVLASGAALALGPVARLAANASENGISDSTIRIGQSAVFTGPAKDFGIDYRAGIQLYFDRVNKAGAVNGSRVLVEGLRRAGRTPTHETLIAGLESIGSTRFGEFPADYNAKNHNGSTFVDLEMYTRDGQLRR